MELLLIVLAPFVLLLAGIGMFEPLPKDGYGGCGCEYDDYED